MCGRFTLTWPNPEDLAEALGAPLTPELSSAYKPRYNVAPTDTHWILRERGGEREITAARWGLVPHFSASIADAAKNINARAETVRKRPGFRDSFKRRRCVVPVDGFYEWIGPPKDRQPIWFHAPAASEGAASLVGRAPLLALAGLDASWIDPKSGNRLRSFTIVTTRPNELVKGAHDRMPVVLVWEDVDAWIRVPELEEDRDGAEERAFELLRPPSDDRLVATLVSKRVNSVKNDDPACLEPAEVVGVELDLHGKEAPEPTATKGVRKKRATKEIEVLPLFGDADLPPRKR